MKFCIVHNPSGDSFHMEAETVEVIQLRVYSELIARGWDKNDCSSYRVYYET